MRGNMQVLDAIKTVFVPGGETYPLAATWFRGVNQVAEFRVAGACVVAAAVRNS
jgi:hypothetical protein